VGPGGGGGECGIACGVDGTAARLLGRVQRLREGVDRLLEGAVEASAECITLEDVGKAGVSQQVVGLTDGGEGAQRFRIGVKHARTLDAECGHAGGTLGRGGDGEAEGGAIGSPVDGEQAPEAIGGGPAERGSNSSGAFAGVVEGECVCRRRREVGEQEAQTSRARREFGAPSEGVETEGAPDGGIGGCCGAEAQHLTDRAQRHARVEGPIGARVGTREQSGSRAESEHGGTMSPARAWCVTRIVRACAFQRRGRRSIFRAMPMTPVREVAFVFTRLGLTAFGGPAAHIAAMDDELVTRRAWLSRDDFADLIGAANLIPGPNSTELAIHLGYRRAGWPGLVVAGCCFIAPAVLLVWGIAWAYVALGARVEVQALLQGMQPAVLAVVVQAIWRLKGSLARTRLGVVLAVLAFLGLLLGVSELVLLLGALVAALLYSAVSRRDATASGAGFAILPWLGSGSVTLPRPAVPIGGAAAVGSAVGAAASLSTGAVFLSFAKIGSVLFGSGYVLLTFLRGEFVTRLGVLSEAQLLDAIAVGQVTPGPVFSAATFVGYLLGGHAGAAAATAGIFLPAFVGVAVTAPLVARLRRSPVLSRTLDAVNAVTLAFMTGVVLLMVRGVVLSPWSLAILVTATLLLVRTRLGAGWVLFGGALAGLSRLLITGVPGTP